MTLVTYGTMEGIDSRQASMVQSPCGVRHIYLHWRMNSVSSWTIYVQLKTRGTIIFQGSVLDVVCERYQKLKE
jgi:hypothetical protein